MANILIYVAVEGGKATPDSLSALNEGRRVSGKLGATLYALLPCADTPTYGDNDIIAVLAAHGADKVVLLVHPDLPDDGKRQNQALDLACDRFPPRLLLLPASGDALGLAPRLSLRLGGEYWALDRLQGGNDEDNPSGRRALSALDSLRDAKEPLVITLEHPVDPRQMGDEEAEVIVLHVGENEKEAAPPPGQTPD